MPAKKIRIDTSGGVTVKHWRIYLDDIEISRFVSKISIDASVNDGLPLVSIMLSGLVEISEEFRALVNVAPAGDR